MNMKSKMTEMLLIIFALFVYVQPASGGATDEVWIPKISGGFFYIQRDSPVRVQFTRNGEKEEATGRITNLNSDKEFKNTYLKVETSTGTLIVPLKNLRFLESIELESKKSDTSNHRDPSQEQKTRGVSAIAVKVGGGIGTSPQGRPWFLSIVFKTAKEQGVDTVIIEFDTPGGILNDGFELTSVILDARESGIKVIGWIEDALSAAARPALACDEIFVKPNARLGGAEWFAHGVTYDYKEIKYKEKVYIYEIPKEVIYHRGNDFLPERIRAKNDSYTDAIDRRLCKKSQIPKCILDAMSVMERELWACQENNTLSSHQSKSSDTLLDDSASVLTLNADQLVNYLEAKRAASINELATALNLQLMDGRELPYRGTGKSTELRKLKSNLKKSADFRVMINNVRDKLADCYERAESLVKLSGIARAEEDQRREKSLKAWEESQTSGSFNRPPPKSIRPLTGPPSLIPVGRDLTSDLRKRVVGCLSMAQRDYDLLEDQINAMLDVDSVTEFIEASRSVRTELRDPRTDIEFIEFIDVLEDEVVPLFYTPK